MSMMLALSDNPAFAMNPGDEYEPPAVIKRPIPELSREAFAQALSDLYQLGFIRIIKGDPDWAQVQRRRPRS
jgi:hypothetical protein